MQQLLDALKAAAEPTRLRLLALCARGELTVSELKAVLGQSQPRVSRHLKVLCNAGLLDRFREQHWVYYRLPVKGPGAKLARRILRLLPGEDDMIHLDAQRLEALLERRTAAARQGLAEDLDGLAPVAGIEALILDAVGDERLGDLLDIGTGTGRMLRLLGPRAETAVGIDISREMLMLARSNLRDAGLDHLMVRQGNMYQLRFADGSFDTVTIDQVLFQAEDPATVVAEAARVLRPGGRLLLVEYLTGEGDADIADPLPTVDEDRLSAWLTAASLQREAWERVSARPWPLVLSIARRAGLPTQAVA